MYLYTGCLAPDAPTHCAYNARTTGTKQTSYDKETDVMMTQKAMCGYLSSMQTCAL